MVGGAVGEEEVWEVEGVDVRPVEEREHWVPTRNTSCFCSSCQEESYKNCHTTRIYPNLVSKMKRDAVIEQCVLMDTGLGPKVNVEMFPKRPTRRKGVPFVDRDVTLPRVCGTRREQSEQAKAESRHILFEEATELQSDLSYFSFLKSQME